MTTEHTIRREMVEAGKRLYFKDLVAACDGNISARLDRDEFLLTPSGVSKGFFSERDILKVNSEGKVILGHGKPTRESHFHLAMYRARPDVNGVVHAHPPIATAFSCAGRDFSRVLMPEVVFELGAIAVARYAVPTTSAVTKSILEVLDETTNAVLLSNHGAVTMGPTVMQAYYNMETLEAVAKVTLAAERVGTPQYLNDGQINELWHLISPGRKVSRSSAESEESRLIESVVEEVVRRLRP